MAGTWIAAALFVAVVAGGVAFVLHSVRSGGSATEPEAEAAETSETASEPVVDPAAATPTTDTTEPAPPTSPTTPVEPSTPEPPRSLEAIAWTVATPSTLDELVRAWSLPRDSLVAFNPALSTTEAIPAGTKLIVHRGSISGSESVGPPNDGRLIGGVPFPEGRSWLLAPDRTRAFGTGETIGDCGLTAGIMAGFPFDIRSAAAPAGLDATDLTTTGLIAYNTIRDAAFMSIAAMTTASPTAGSTVGAATKVDIRNNSVRYFHEGIDPEADRKSVV